MDAGVTRKVSIVSIRQINPDDAIIVFVGTGYIMFQSYQFRQINPDLSSRGKWSKTVVKGFNRINSGRSIPTRNMHTVHVICREDVSIVSIQADQSRRWLLYRSTDYCNVSIVSIQADQSRPVMNNLNMVHEMQVSIVSIQADQSRLWI